MDNGLGHTIRTNFEMAKNIWSWKSKKWWLWVLGFWFVSAIGSGIVARAGGGKDAEDILILSLLFIFSISATITDREWGVGLRVLWLIGIPIGFF